MLLLCRCFYGPHTPACTVAWTIVFVFVFVFAFASLVCVQICLQGLLLCRFLGLSSLPSRDQRCVCVGMRACVCVFACVAPLSHITHTHASPLPQLTSALASHFSTDEWQAEDGCQQPQASKEAVYVAHTRAHAFLCPCNAVPRFLNLFMQCKVESVHVLTTTPLLLPPLPSSLSLSITVDMTKQIARHVDCLSSLEKV